MSRKGVNWGEAFEHLPAAALVVDAERAVLAVNREARKALGRARSRARRLDCRALRGCLIDEALCPLKRALATGRPVARAVVPVEGPQGRAVTIERVGPYRDPATGRRRAVILFGDATAHLRALNQLRSQARVDVLTRVLTRRRFEQRLSSACRRERRKQPASFVMLDVDGLKAINDRQGHAMGDCVLRRLGGLLRAQARSSDIVGRLGGDEFGVFCPNTSLAEARIFARRLRRAIARDNAAHPQGPVVSVSVGIASSRRGFRAGIRAQADVELIRAKGARKGRGRG